MQPTTTSNRVKPTPTPDPVFDGYMERVQRRVAAMLAEPKALFFTTNADGLFAAYLAAFPEHLRQHHNCHACRHFLDTYGGLVVIGETGQAASPIWNPDEAPEPYAAPVRAIAARVAAAKVTGIFFSKGQQLGTPLAGGWTHLSLQLPASYLRLHNMTLTPGQAQAEKREDLKNVLRVLDEFSPEVLSQAVQVLQSEALYRSEKLLGAAEWLANLQKMRREVKDSRVRHNLTWRTIALAPAGFCHPRGGMLGTLLEDIEARLPFAEIKRRFDEKMHPLQYQRPQAAPSAGTIAQAEKIVEQMGIAASLRRRFARIDEVEALWRPKEAKPEPARNGVFGHLTPKGRDALPALDLPAKVVTWEKFQRTILPDAEAIEFFVPYGANHYCALTTAADAEAPPILQWDTPEKRNPVAWYVYDGGSTPQHFGLQGGEWAPVTAVAFQPTAWNGRSDSHHGESVIFCLAGCHDTVNRGGLALFPECLKSELHGVRSVIEAHSHSGRLEEIEGRHAAGFRLQKGASSRARFRIASKGQRLIVEIDRWD